MELKSLYENFDESSDPYDRGMCESRPTMAIKPAWKSSKIFEPHSVTYVSPQPTDRFNFIAFVVLLEGMALFLPINMFINAEPFFRDIKFSDIYNNGSKTRNKSEFVSLNKNHLIFYFGMTSTISSLIAILFSLLLPISPVLSLTRRVTISIVFQSLVISLIVIVTIANTSDLKIIYVFITIISIILLNVSNGVFQTSIHAMTAFLPKNYSRILMLGIYFGATLMTVLQMVSIILIQNQRLAYIYYFVVSILFLLACFDFYYISSLSRFYRYFKNKLKNNRCKEFDDFMGHSYEDWSLFSILSKTWKHYLNIYLVCLVSNVIYPSLEVNIRPVCDSLTFIPNKLFTPITSHLLFNMSSMFGCWLTNADFTSRHLSSKLWLINGFRLLLIPIHVFCHLMTKSCRLSVIANKEYLRLLGNAFLGLSNGYLLTYSVMNAPKCVKPDQSMTAGMLSALFIMFGLMCGSIISFVIISFVV